jgi:hypothetical protein
MHKGQFVAISVMDTGSGIAADKLEAISEPFFTTKDVGRVRLGSTPGAWVRQTVWRRNYVTSALGEGSTFTIYLPKAEKAADDAEGVAIGAEAVMGGRGHCVLVVEDNEDVGRFSTELLQDLGYGIKWVGNAKEAL